MEDWLPVSAMEIIERIRNSQLDAVISDYNLPHVDGLTVLKMVKRANPELPVIILTAVRNPEREERLVTGGVARILHKPVTVSDLAQAVRQVVGPGQQG